MWNRETAAPREDASDARTAASPGQLGETVQAANPALMTEERRTVAWVGKSVVFKGTLISSEDMTIDGHVEGTIDIVDQSLTIGPDADIRADIAARSVIIHGTVIGNIRATGKVDIRATGRMDGDLIAPRVVLADGALLRGRVDTASDPAGAAKRSTPSGTVVPGV